MTKLIRGSTTIFAAAVLQLSLSNPLLADEIVLEMKGGGFSVSGELLGFDGKSVTIDSKALGRISLDASRFDCVSGSCPNGIAKKDAEAPAAAAAGNSNRLVAAEEGFSVHGSNTIGARLMPALIKAYATSISGEVKTVVGNDPKQVTFEVVDGTGNTLFKIDLQRYGSATAFPDLATGVADIGMSDRKIEPKEVAMLVKSGIKNMGSVENEHVFGLDGIVVVVSPQSPVNALSIDDIAKVFSGAVTDWSQLGFAAGKINVYAPDDKQGTFGTFNSLLLKPRKLTISADAERFDSNADIADKVAADANAIGLTSFAFKRESKPLSIQSVCGLITKPSQFSVKSEEYVLSRRLYLYTTGQLAHPQARAFLDFVKSPAGQAVVTDNEFTDQSVDALAFQDQGGRIAYALNAPAADFNMPMMREMIGDLTNAKRLSTTIRFVSGSFEIDSRGRDDINRLVAVLRSEDLKGKELLLLGFADSTGEFVANRLLAQRRAMRVLEEISRASEGTINATVIVSKSFSELAPIACNSDLQGRDLNRRVEVWVREHGVAPKLAGLKAEGGLFQDSAEGEVKSEAAATDGGADVAEQEATVAPTKKKALVKKKKPAAEKLKPVEQPAEQPAGTPTLLEFLTGGAADPAN